jgi:hypothetical protein
MNPSFTSSHKLYLSALGHTGRAQEAARVRQRLILLEPDFTVERFLATTPLEREADRRLCAEGLALAGVPARDADLAAPVGTHELRSVS